MAKNKHLTLSERILIETSLNEGKSFKMIAKDLGKDPCTISKEVRLHRINKSFLLFKEEIETNVLNALIVI